MNKRWYLLTFVFNHNGSFDKPGFHIPLKISGGYLKTSEYQTFTRTSKNSLQLSKYDNRSNFHFRFVFGYLDMCHLTCISLTFTESWNHSSVDPAERDKLGHPSAKHATNHNAHAFSCFNQYLQRLSAQNQCFKNWTGPAGSTWSDWNGHLYCTRLLGPFPYIHWLLAGQKTAAT